MKIENPYKVLGLKFNATGKEIRKAYHVLARKYHPDIYKAPNAHEIFQKLNQAYQILSDPKQKTKVDKIIRAQMQKKNASASSIYYEKNKKEKENDQASPTEKPPKEWIDKIYQITLTFLFNLLGSGIWTGLFFIINFLQNKNWQNQFSLYLIVFLAGFITTNTLKTNFLTEYFFQKWGFSFDLAYTLVNTIAFSFLLSYLGKNIDQFFNIMPIFSTLGILLGSLLGSYLVNRRELRNYIPKFSFSKRFIFIFFKTIAYTTILVFFFFLLSYITKFTTGFDFLWASLFMGGISGLMLGIIPTNKLKIYLERAMSWTKFSFIMLWLIIGILLGLVGGILGSRYWDFTSWLNILN